MDQFNLRVSDQGVPLEEIKATRAELKGDGTELDGQKFDLVIVRVIMITIRFIFADIIHTTVHGRVPPFRKC